MSYAEWAIIHATMFGLDRPEDMKMLDLWIDVFRGAGHTPDELHAVTQWLALNAPPSRWEHLQAIQRRLAETRHNQARPRPEEDPHGTCADCGGAGLVSVPHPYPPPNGRWYTAAVLCHCPLGRWLEETQRSDEPKYQRMNYLEYSKIKPAWRDELRQHTEFLKASIQAEGLTKHLDKTLGTILRQAREVSRHGQATENGRHPDGNGCSL